MTLEILCVKFAVMKDNSLNIISLLIGLLGGAIAFWASGLSIKALFDNGPWSEPGYLICILGTGLLLGLFGKRGITGIIGVCIGQFLALTWIELVDGRRVTSTGSIGYFFAVIGSFLSYFCYLIILKMRNALLKKSA
jgi:hypothetical protein